MKKENCKHEWREGTSKNSSIRVFYCIYCLAEAIKEIGKDVRYFEW